MRHLKHKFKGYFVAGLVVLAPLFLSILVIGYLFRLADAFIVNPVFKALPLDIDATVAVYLAKLAIGLVVIFLVTLIGVGTRKFILTNLTDFGESILKNIPVFNRVYLLLKEITGAFFDDKRGLFKRVVFLEYPRKGIYSMAFVTQEKPWELSRVTGKDVISIFVPSPPNPATGMFMFVPREELIEANVSVEDGIKLVISGGASLPSSTSLEK